MGVYKQILNKNFIIMIICVILGGTAQMAVNTNLAGYCTGVLGITQAQYGTIIAVTGVVVVVTYPFIGILCDKMRHGICGAIGGAILAAGFLLSSFVSGTFATVMIARCVQYLGFGFIINATLSVAAMTKPQFRSAAMTLYGLGPALSYFTGPQTGTIIYTNFGYNTMFIVSTVIAVVCAVLSLFCTSKPAVNPDAPKKKAFGFEKTAVPGFILSFLILQIVFIAQSYATLSLLERGISQAALFWTVGAVINIIARLFITNLIGKIGINNMFYITVALLVIAVLCIALSTNLALVLVAAACWGIGYNGAQASIMSVSVLRAPAERVGQANSTHQMGHNAAQIVWSQIAGILVGVIGYQGMFLCMIIPIIAGVIFYVVYVRKIVNKVMAERKAAQIQAQ